jgi:large subunit ribosomal protein L29
MRISEVRAMATAEIEAKLDDTREELFKLRFQFKTGQLTDYSRLTERRRAVARLLTVLRERELAQQLAGEGEQA